MCSDEPERQQAMTAERLAEIRASLESLNAKVQAALNPPPSIVDLRNPEPVPEPIPISTIFMAMTALELLHAVERLRTREAALLAVVERVAAWGDHTALEFLSPYYCPHCDLPARDEKDWPIVEHLPDCPVTQARALLAASPDATTAE